MNLKPCPFCGGEAQMKTKNFDGEKATFYIVECIPEEHSMDCYSLTGRDAAEEWNTRTPDTTDITRLYEWLTNPNREPAQTAFTAGILRDVAREVEMILKVSGKSNFAASVKNANPARLDELLRKADLIPDDPQDEVEPTDSELHQSIMEYIDSISTEAPLPKSNCIDPLFEIKGCDMPKGSCADCGKHPIEDGKVSELPTTRQHPPVLEWDVNYAKSVNYQCAIYEKTAIDYVVECYYMGVRFYNDIHCQSSARLAAENAVLRHWIENLK